MKGSRPGSTPATRISSLRSALVVRANASAPHASTPQRPVIRTVPPPAATVTVPSRASESTSMSASRLKGGVGPPSLQVRLRIWTTPPARAARPYSASASKDPPGQARSGQEAAAAGGRFVTQLQGAERAGHLEGQTSGGRGEVEVEGGTGNDFGQPGDGGGEFDHAAHLAVEIPSQLRAEAHRAGEGAG